jgi:hypothetical protein
MLLALEALATGAICIATNARRAQQEMYHKFSIDSDALIAANGF